MPIIPMLQIRQTPAILHIDADPGQYSIRQPSADMELKTRRAQLEIHQYQPQLTIDQSAAFSAYNGGNYLEMNNRIYSGLPQIFLQAIAHKVEQGNRMAAIHIPGNTVANVFGEDTETHVLPEFRGPASMDNVDIHVETRAPDITYTPAVSEMHVTVNRPEIEYTRGKLEIYMQQYPSVAYIPPEIDVMM
ncbi:hypothetical protein KSP24_05800 [Paenibacillus sp. AK121]|uniref:DUF6470 family protein n=1 Tax=Paenibacillus TaxID=44249 RepID=UPI000F9B3A3C|nr:DUF6470 family protein [Paenibacillus sp. AK121]MBU9706443.1 hypothetical protein [Paenibacillus sp. AK121]MEE4567364.1 DUF6470 family protein [Paenibacillus polymyxa]